MKADTLTGDIRDMLLTHIRSMETPWSKLSEREQGEKIEVVTEAAKNLVRNAVAIVADKGFPNVTVKIVEWKVKGGIKLVLETINTVENIVHLADQDGASAVLVLCDVQQFFGEAAAAKPDPDQPDMLGTDAEPPEDEPSAGPAPLDWNEDTPTTEMGPATRRTHRAPKAPEMPAAA